MFVFYVYVYVYFFEKGSCYKPDAGLKLVALPHLSSGTIGAHCHPN